MKLTATLPNAAVDYWFVVFYPTVPRYPAAEGLQPDDQLLNRYQRQNKCSEKVVSL